MEPPPTYSIPPRTSLLPVWGKALIGCGVLGILIVLLAGVGLTRLTASLRETRQTLYCVRNLREAQRGLDLYSQDYDQSLPQASAWMDAATPYVKNRTNFKCPVVYVANHNDFGYAFNRKLAGSKMSQIARPETTSVVYDSTDVRRNAADAFTSLPSPPRHIIKNGRAARNGPLHGNVVLYADGHVRLAEPDGVSVDAASLDLRRTLFAPRPKKK